MPFVDYIRADLVPREKAPLSTEDDLVVSYDRELGELSVRLNTLEKDVAEMSRDVRQIRDTLTQAKGGWRLVMIVSGFSATIGAALAKLFPFLMALPR